MNCTAVGGDSDSSSSGGGASVNGTNSSSSSNTNSSANSVNTTYNCSEVSTFVANSPSHPTYEESLLPYNQTNCQNVTLIPG